MKQFYLKTFVLFLLSMAWIEVAAYDCKIDGIYYYLRGDSASVTYNKYYTETNGPDYPEMEFWDTDYSGSVVIPSSIKFNNKVYRVTRIGDHAFIGSYGLTSVTIPNSVKYISDKAFYKCI